MLLFKNMMFIYIYIYIYIVTVHTMGRNEVTGIDWRDEGDDSNERECFL